MDKTEVTMEVTAFDAASPNTFSNPSAQPTPSASTPAAGPSSPSEDPSEDPNIGGVQKVAAVEKALAPVRPRLRVCYKRALAIEPTVGGSAIFDATIGKGGKVSTVRFVKHDGLSEDMVSCLIPAIKAMTFEGNAKSQILTLSFGKPRAGASDAGADH